MKKILPIFIYALGFSPFAQANELPPVSNVTVVVDKGSELAAVQPTARISFVIRSCRERKLNVSTEKTGNTVFISVSELDGSDCRAAAMARKYTLQVSTDATSESYVLLNPIAPFYN